MHSFAFLLFGLAHLVTAQEHIAVLGADGVSVGYHDDASSQVATPVEPEQTPPDISYTSSGLSLEVRPIKAPSLAQFSAEAEAMQPVVDSAPTGNPSTEQPEATLSASGTAPRADGRCGPKYNNAVCDPNGMYGGCCS